MGNLNFNDVKEGLKHGQLRAANLEDIKGHFEADRLRLNDIQKKALRSKEKQTMDELHQLKRDKELLYHQRNNVRLNCFILII